MKRTKQGQGGFIVSLELIFIATCMLCVVVIGWASVGSKIIGEYADIGSAVGSLNQSFFTSGMVVQHPADPVHPEPVAFWAGSSFEDHEDFCDAGLTCGVIACIAPSAECDPLPIGGTP
jgi:hypothetical protein